MVAEAPVKEKKVAEQSHALQPLIGPTIGPITGMVPRFLQPQALNHRLHEAIRESVEEAPEMAAGFVTLLINSASAIAATFGLWRLAADMHLASEFFIREGLFSRWQVWLALAFALKAGTAQAIRYGRGRTRTL